MSDNFLRLIAADPAFVPEAAAAEKARAYLTRLVPDADCVSATITERIQFVDQGANFERVSCPECGSALPEDWWSDAVEHASETAFASLDVSVPCCGRTVSLNELDYEWPAGFARFVLEAMNPNVRDLDEEEVASLALILGTTLRRIWAHY
jgi:hypothetical protein